MDIQEENLLRQYAWSYFALHADQRMKTVHFFILSAGLLAGGITTLLKNDVAPWCVIPLGALLTLLSLIFWKIDRRNRALVRNGENAIKALDMDRNLPDETDGGPSVLRIFDRDDYKTGLAKGFLGISGHFGYGRLLGTLFSLFAALGLYFVVYGLLANRPNKLATTGPNTSIVVQAIPSAVMSVATQTIPSAVMSVATQTIPSAVMSVATQAMPKAAMPTAAEPAFQQ